MTENHPLHIVTFSKGVNTQTEPEIVGAQEASGIYLDGHNTRPVSTDGNEGANEKIKGEQLTYPNNKALTNYKCIGSESVKGHLIELWADNSGGAGPGICVIDGVIVIKSVDFELRVDYPVQQMAKCESFDEGEFGFTDKRSTPYWFNIKDLIDSLTIDPNKYFSAFEPKLYQVNLQSPLDRPVFVELINVGGGGGLPVGHYQYQMRYVTDEGDRTNWSMVTPMIPIMQGLSSDSRIFPWIKTFGGPPNPQSLTAYAIKLRFRVTNIYNYEYIEIKRLAYNQGAGIEYTAPGVIVAKIAIRKQEISVKEYIDPAEANSEIVLSANDETQQLVELKTAGSMRYYDRRLVFGDIELASRESSLTFEEINGEQGFPVIDKIYKEGHKDPWNHVNRRHYMHGEKFSFGTALFDGVGTKAFVTRMEKLSNYQFPNRRDTISADTANYSYDGTVKAADVGVTSVGQTHEVFDLGDPRYKADECEFKNIVRKGKVVGLTGSRTLTKVKEDCNEDTGEIQNHGAYVAGNNVTAAYHPFTPVRQSDPDTKGHDYVVDTKVFTDAVDTNCYSTEGETQNYRPSGFAPDYYAQGLMVAGVDNFPTWAKAFSIVRTAAAKRVVCQGLGFYAMTQAKYKVVGNESLGGKEQNKFWFYSPDIEQGIVSSDTLNDIIENPQNYKIQMVSPLGFFSEVYSFEDNLLACNRDRLIDMVAYVRMLRDNDNDPNNQINPGEDPSMGISGSDGYNYIRYDKFRNVTQDPNVFASDASGGNAVFDLAAVRRKVDGRGNFIEIETNANIYGKASVGGGSDRHFANAGLKDFTEPMYIINIIRTGANINDKNVQKYRPTDHYQKLESIIGKGTGLANQKYPLVDERWEDCIPAPSASTFGAGTNRFLYIKKNDGSVQKWINTTYMTSALRSLIEATITGSGFYTLGPDKIYGVYKHINNVNRFYDIHFYHSVILPADGDFIIVKYDKTAPIRVYGGDSFIGESIFAPIDRLADAKEKAAETQFAWGVGLPFFKWKLNPRYYTIRKAGAALNVVQDELKPSLGYIRQLCAMFCVEARSAVHLAYNSDYPNQFFPLTNYVIRPNRWDEDKSVVDNGIFQDYEDDYGDEKSQWQWGGFRFLPQINPDYSVESPLQFLSKPLFGFEEKTKFRSRAMWTLQRTINVQDAPGLRTFPANSVFDIDDATGAIVRLYDDISDKGDNIYAVTENGICLMLTKKSILSDLGSGDIGYMSADGLIKGQYWFTKEIGMPDKFWRSATEAYVSVKVGDNSEVRKRALFFANKESIFRFMDNTVMDIAKESYYKNIYNNGLTKITAGLGTHMASGYNKLYNEYYLHIKNEDIDLTFAYGQGNGYWHGTNDFKFDRFTSMGNRLFGHRDLETYELNLGYTLNGSPVVSKLTGVAAPEQMFDKEFIAIRVNSLQGQKPSEIHFRELVDGPVVASLSQAIQGPLYMKDYRGYEAHIPRILASIDSNRPLFQQRVIIFEILHNLASEFKVIDVAIQYKKLKIK